MLSVPKAADYLGVSTSFLNKSRITGDGPQFHKLGRRVVYAPFELDTWLDERKRRNTSESASVRGRRRCRAPRNRGIGRDRHRLTGSDAVRATLFSRRNSAGDMLFRLLLVGCWPLPVSACCGRPKSTLLQAAVPAARFRQCPVLRRLGTGGDGVSVAGGAGLVHSGHQPWRSRRALQALTVQASSSAQRSPRPAPAWRSHISAVSSRVGSLARPGLGTRDISASSAGTSAKSRSIASLP
jgi:hypothetical protein